MAFSRNSILRFHIILLVSWALLTCGTVTPFVGPPNELFETAFDFIIVGGGTAGVALASLLSQGLPNSTILLLEAGPYAPDEPNINIPGRKGSTIGGVYDWNLSTTPQAGLNQRKISASRGRVLGGSSALNLLSWDRAAVADYDAWEALGNTGWNWTTFRAAMLRVENFDRTNDLYAGYYTQGVGVGGPIQTLVNRFVPPQQEGFFPAMERLGIQKNRESLDGNPLGAIPHVSNIRESNYSRSYSVEYLRRAGPNLTVWTNTTVSKIEFLHKPSEPLVATGVRIDDGTTILTARKEVILSAGSLLSPTLLERSGIGNSSILSAAGINVLLDMPAVGSNLQDHIRIQNTYRLKPNYTVSSDEVRTNATYAAEQMALYEQGQPSVYDYTATSYAYLTWDQALGANKSAELTALARESADAANIIDQRKLAYLTTANLRKQVASLEIIYSDGYTGVKGPPTRNSSEFDTHYFTLIAVVMHPLARGSVHINTTNTISAVMDARYLSNSYDLRAIVEATQYSRRIAMQPGLVETWDDEYEPGLGLGSDDPADWESFARNTTLTIYHPLGTCAMLPRESEGVVSPELVVYGTTNVRVVDASVIPILPSGHIQTMVYGIAEMAAEKIVAQYSRSAR